MNETLLNTSLFQFLQAAPSSYHAVAAIANKGAVPESVRERFFEKYATAGKARGTGLGTYSARLIALSHGGDIAMATDDAGTVVTVRLPASGSPALQK